MGALESDKPNLTESERLMGEIAQTARAATMLILAEAARSGLIREADGSWDLHAGAKELGKFLAVERGALQAIGLDRRARPTASLESYLEATYRRADSDEERTPSRKRTHS